MAAAILRNPKSMALAIIWFCKITKIAEYRVLL